MENIKKAGIIGCGFVGGALKKWLEENTKHQIAISDPPLGYNDDLTGCDVFFISIHIPTENNGTQDLTVLKSIIAKLPQAPIFIRTTVLPTTCDSLSKEFSRKIYFMPEFLTQRTAYENFCNQPMIFTGEIELLQKIFPYKSYEVMSNIDAEITKYTHNVFGALKVTYFNGIYNMCQKFDSNYDNVVKGCLLSDYINADHTEVPGPDGKLGYGGKCFPKDVNAFVQMTKDLPIYELLKPLKDLNIAFRGDEE